MPYVLDLQNNNKQKPVEPPKAQKKPEPETKAPQDVQKTEPPPVAAEEPLELSWQAPEYAQSKKSPDWYWAVGIITLGFFITALIFDNILFGVFMLLAGFTIALYGARPPRTITFTLSPGGIRIENRMYSYDTLTSFWIFYDPPHIKELSIESQKLVMPHIKIPLGAMNPAAVRSYLQQFLREKQQEESLIDIASKYLGF
jgi:hypothetical protein